MRLFLVAAAVAACAACPQPTCEQKSNLLVKDAWTRVEPADDPFASDAPAGLVEKDADGHYPPDDPGSDTPHDVRVCTDAEVYTEVLGKDDSLTVDTNLCGWATVEQPLSADVAEGDPMFARVFYFQQIAPGIAEAHLELTVDGKPFWTRTIPLPTPSQLIAEDFDAPFSAKKGQTLMWHVDNHGVNTYNLIEISKKTCPKG